MDDTVLVTEEDLLGEIGLVVRANAHVRRMSLQISLELRRGPLGLFI